MIPSVTMVLNREVNPVVHDALSRIGKALEDIVIHDGDVPSFSTQVELGAPRSLSHGERVRIKVTLNEKGWDATFKLDALLNEIAVVFIKQ